MREIVLDTETTGFDPEQGDRIVEIGCVELINHLPTGNTYHVYINPERDMPDSAFQVHGLSSEFLSDKPIFAQISHDFFKYIKNTPLIIHNAKFDMRFINAELKWAQLPPIPATQAIDTLDLARRKFPGAQNSLDALCRRFKIDNSAREKHGALLDSELLAEVYLELIGGRQPNLVLDDPKKNHEKPISEITISQENLLKHRAKPLGSRLNEREKEAHRQMVEMLGNAPLWHTKGN